jgi:hypothetical protein
MTLGIVKCFKCRLIQSPVHPVGRLGIIEAGTRSVEKRLWSLIRDPFWNSCQMFIPVAAGL